MVELLAQGNTRTWPLAACPGEVCASSMRTARRGRESAVVLEASVYASCAQGTWPYEGKAAGPATPLSQATFWFSLNLSDRNLRIPQNGKSTLVF
jgi:hypothetical protein